MTRNPRRSIALVAAIAAAVGALTMTGIVPASASAGSVPPEVTRYVTTGPMVERLDDVYGPNADGTKGVDFDATTKPGPISRVWVWTAERRAGKPTADPTRMTNRWVDPVTVAGHPIGVATIWINPDLDAPELAEFQADPAAAVALAAVPASAQLVHDTVSRAWLALAAGVVTPLVPGSTGLSTPVPVDEFAIEPAAAAASDELSDPTGWAIGGTAFVVLIALSVVVLVISRLRFASRPPIT